MLSIPRKVASRPGGDYRKACASCGIEYMRSEMWRGEDRLLRCKETCADGRPQVTLDRLAARNGSRPRRSPRGEW